jgi:catechol 2,3-dioxygenase-like lactoylglutathione lyase family enzyme
MNARLRYLAVMTKDPARISDFYIRNFSMEEVGRSKEGDITTTDGFFNITFMKPRPELHEASNAEGLHHIGIEVDDIGEAIDKYNAFCPHMPVIAEPGGLHFGEKRIFGPEGMVVSLSERSFGMGAEVNRLPRLRHIACNAYWPEEQMNFFLLIFGFRELEASRERRSQGRGNRFCGDGTTNLAIHPFYNPSEGHEAKYGVNHFGFLLSDMNGRLETLAKEIPIAKRPTSRPYAEYRLHDIDGNKFDLSETKGWEIGVDKWAKSA